MARFDVYRNVSAGKENTPYLLDVQADLLDELETRVVIPLRRRDRFAGGRVPAELMPVVEIEGAACIVETPKLAAVPVRMLGARVGSLAAQRSALVGALDFLFEGY